MEFPDIAKELNIEIDISHYLEKTVGLCACFINDDERYQPPPSHNIMQIKDSDEREKRVDAYSQNESKKWLKKYIKLYNKLSRYFDDSSEADIDEIIELYG